MTFEHLDTVLAFAMVMLLLSLVITTLVQIVVGVLGLRGKNLIWGVTKLLERFPNLKDHSDEIVKHALEHPAITPIGKKATVIGSSELLTVLKDLADSDSELPQAAKDALNSEIEKAVPEEARNHAKRLAEEFKKLFPSEAAKMTEALGVVEAKASQLMSDFDTWFDTIMNRTTDRYIQHTRRATVAFAVLLSVGLHIDALDIIEDLSTDAELRASLLQTADQTLARADEVLLATPLPVEALDSVSQSFPQLVRDNIPVTLATRGQGVAWLSEEFGDSSNFAAMRQQYETQFDALTRTRLESLGNRALELTDQLEESRLVVMPRSWTAYGESWRQFPSHLPGVILSVFLLSLGAPFWYKALRTLSTLRPVLAGKPDPSKPPVT